MGCLAVESQKRRGQIRGHACPFLQLEIDAMHFVRRVGGRVGQVIVGLAAIDALILSICGGRSFLEVFPESKAAIQHGILQLVIMAAGFMFMLQQKRYGGCLLLVALYVVARDVVAQFLVMQALR
jgi:hypothetical protein